MTTRRHFLAGTAILPATFAAGVPRHRLLAQVYVFTQELSRRKVALADGIDEIFSTTRNAGFHAMELMSHLFTPELRGRTIASVKKHGIDVPITYCGGAMHTVEGGQKTRAAILETADTATAVGTVAINHNPDPIGRAKTDDELKLQAENLNRLGEALGKHGQKLFVHHHNPEMADNAREWRYTLAHTDPALVQLCVDTHWAYRGGQDFMAIVREAGKRLASLHLRNSVNGIWSESFGAGDLDYGKSRDYLKRAKLSPYLVVELAYEEKTPHRHTLEENLRAGREYAERVFGVRA